ncbi:energy transducer TonB [Pseudoxanthomonas sp. Root630]|uniref:energy transducer TonB n=1 Tax=Pseudoxanthomonas sp. Root630 TaxID=1736574 RepID=UPI000703AC9F|nr:energy transducer TonB [Pseudoxanthomonas sp. Root630]
MKAGIAMGLLLASASLQAGEAGEPVRFPATARVVLDAEGVPQQVQANPKLPSVVRHAVEERIARWRFEPARVNGVPKPGITHVRLKACAIPQADGGMRIGMDYAANGPGYADDALRLPPLPYPPLAARAGAEGSFELTVRVGRDGRASLASVKTRRGSVGDFRHAMEAWVDSIRYQPEVVDGHPIETQLRFPVAFFFETRTASSPDPRTLDARSPECAAAAGQQDDPMTPVVLDSPFKPLSTG